MEALGGDDPAPEPDAVHAISHAAVLAEPASSAFPAYGHEPFSGWAATRMEPNGRVIIPSTFRYAFTSGLLYVRARRQECLMLYTPKGFRLLVDDALAEANDGVVDPRMRQDVFLFAPKLTIDRQFRIVVPSDMRDQAGLGEEVVFGGQIEALHLYSSAAFERRRKQQDAFDLVLDGHSGLSTDPV